MRDDRDDLCPFCGADSPRQCDLEEETGGVCPWEEMDERERKADALHNGGLSQIGNALMEGMDTDD